MGSFIGWLTGHGDSCSTWSVAGTARKTDIGTVRRRDTDVDITVGAAIPVVLAGIGDDRSRGPWHPVRTADLALRTYGGPSDGVAIGPRRGCGDDDSDGSRSQCQSQYQVALSGSHGCSLFAVGKARRPTCGSINQLARARESIHPLECRGCVRLQGQHCQPLRRDRDRRERSQRCPWGPVGSAVLTTLPNDGR